MSKTKITVVGKLIQHDGALCYALSQAGQETEWLEALPNTDNWPTLGHRPKYDPQADEQASTEKAATFIREQLKSGPARADYLFKLSDQSGITRKALYQASKLTAVRKFKQEFGAGGVWMWELTAESSKDFPVQKEGLSLEEWLPANSAYTKALHSDRSYLQAASEFMERQQREPTFLPTAPHTGLTFYWAYRGKVLRLESTDPEVVERTTSGLRITDKSIVLMKQYVLRREKHYEKARREVEALETMEKLESVSREPIPDRVRLFVWQRDKGQCVKCSSRERLEFDHIIPIAAGGGNTERNIQLLCELCNRSKGAGI